METRDTVHESLIAARSNIYWAAEQKSKFIALPEYFSVPGRLENYSSAAEIYEKTYKTTVDFLRQVSRDLLETYIVGGTLIEKEGNSFFNTCTIWKGGRLLGSYKKRNLINIEVKMGLSKGKDPLVLPTEICRVGVLICADIFYPETVEETVNMGAEVIFLPVAALYTHPDVRGHPLSEKIASENGIFILKIGNVRSGAKGGRSAVIAPWGVIQEAPDVLSDFVLTADLDLNRLKFYREQLSNKIPSTSQ